MARSGAGHQQPSTIGPSGAASAGRKRDVRSNRRRDELADAALTTLGKLGYARTSLREIAHNSDYSHGVVHYYFDNKDELISYGVRRYKQICATRYDELVERSTDADELRIGFAALLRQTLIEDTPMHRLWYDMRTQSMFEVQLRQDVILIDDMLEQMIWRVVTKYAQLRGKPQPPDSRIAYVTFDGMFENCLIRYHIGEADALEQLESMTARILDRIVGECG